MYYLNGFPAVAEKDPLTDLQERSKGFFKLAKLFVDEVRIGAGGLLTPTFLAERGGFCEKYDEFIF